MLVVLRKVPISLATLLLLFMSDNQIFLSNEMVQRIRTCKFLSGGHLDREKLEDF